MAEGLNLNGMTINALGEVVPDIMSVSTPSLASQSLTALAKPNLSVADGAAIGAGGAVGSDTGSLFGGYGDVLGTGMDIAKLGLGFLNYKDAHAMNKANLAGMDQNLKNAATEAQATADYRAAYKPKQSIV